MKKLLAGLLTLAMIMSLATFPALAESETEVAEEPAVIDVVEGEENAAAVLPMAAPTGLPEESALLCYSTFDTADVSGTLVKNLAPIAVEGNKWQGTASATVQYAEGVKGQALKIGENDSGKASASQYVEYTTGFVPATGNYSVSLWYKSTGVSNDGCIVGNKDYDNGANKGFVLGSFEANGVKDLRFNIGDGAKRVELAGNTSGSSLEQMKTMKDGEWHHFVGNVDRAGNLSVYVDGVLAGEKTVDISSSTSLGSGYPMVVGADGLKKYGSGNFMLDELRMYNRTLTTAEVTALYNDAKPDGPEPEPEPETGLLLHSTFDTADVDGVTVKDSSGKNHNGTIVGSTITFEPGLSGNCLKLGAKGGYVDYGKSASIIPATTSFSVSLWYKRDGANNDGSLLGTKDYKTGDNQGMVIGTYYGTSNDLRINMADASKKRVELNGQTTNDNYALLRTLQDGDWHHLAASYDRAGNLVAYVDGVQAGSESLTGYKGSIDAGLKLALGADGNGAYPSQQCRVDELQIYGRALNAEEVKDLYDLNAAAAKAANTETILNTIQTSLTGVKPSVVFPQSAIDAMQAKLDEARGKLEDSGLSDAEITVLVEGVEEAFQKFGDGAKPLASFHLISDVHIETGPTAYQQALADMADLNSETNIALVNAGDFTEDSQRSEYKTFYDLTNGRDKEKLPDEEMLILLGNHDVRGRSADGGWVEDPSASNFPYWETAKSLYKEFNAPYMPALKDGDALYYSKTLGGYTFLMLNTEKGMKDAMYMSQTQLDWLDAQLAAAKDSGKPVFIVCHQALNDTHWRSNIINGFDGVNKDGTPMAHSSGIDGKVKAILEKHQNGVFLSGHIHNGLGVVEAIPRPFGLTVEIPSFMKSENGVTAKGVGWEVYIYEHNLAFRARNFTTGTWLPEYDIVVDWPGIPQSYSAMEKQFNADQDYYSWEDYDIVNKVMGDLKADVTRKYDQTAVTAWDDLRPPAKSFYQAADWERINSEAENLAKLLAETPKQEEPRPERPDPYDALRLKWREYLLGGDGTDLDMSSPAVAAYVEGLNGEATGYWNSMVKSNSARADYIFPGLPMTQDKSNEKSGNIGTTLQRLRILALAWATADCDFYGNSYVRDEIINATDFVVDNYFKLGKYSGMGDNAAPGNWYHWEITDPTNLGNIAMVMYDELGAERVEKYAKAMQYYAPSCTSGGPNSKGPVMVGGNRLLKANGVAQAGILLKDSAMLENVSSGIKNTLVYNDPSKLFLHSDNEIGFYKDGSYIEHQALPYIAGYGADFYNNYGIFGALLKDTEWEIAYAPGEEALIHDFVFSGIEPFLYETRTMDMVAGRDISRNGSSDRGRTVNVLSALLSLRGTFPTAEGNKRFDSMMKYYIGQDKDYYYSHMPSINAIQIAKGLMEDESVQPRSNYALTKTFAMDRSVHITPDFGLGIAMQSLRTFAHETINSEGKRTWNIANGMFFLYDADEKQFGGNYWCTVDPTRLPGITAEHVVLPNGMGTMSTNLYDWTGGSSIGGSGVAGTHMKALTSKDTHESYISVGPRTGADMKKSYFMFGDRILMMGSSITSGTTDHVETTVDNRKIKPDGSNVVTVDGKQANLTSSATALENPDWLHITGNVAGADVGYYFPNDITVNALKETRTGNWADQGTTSGTATDTYATFYVDHGVKPTDAGYAYVLLPGKSAAQTAAYAKSPDVEILRQDGQIHAARDNRQNITAVNFWEAGSVAGITVSAPASVTVEVKGDTMTIGVSDPTQRDVPITLTMAVAGEKISADAKVAVDETVPFIKFSVDTTEGLGGTYTASFRLDKSEQLELVSAVTQVEDVTVTSGTPFSELGLPTTGVFVATDIAEHTLPILWARGEYKANAYGTYSVVGTPVLPEGVLNSGDVKLVVAVKVADEVLTVGDTYIRGNDYGNEHHGSDSSLAVKLDTSANYERLALFQFKLTGLPAEYDALWFAFQGGYDESDTWQSAELYQIGSGWDEIAATWSNTAAARASKTKINSFGRSQFNSDGIVKLDVTAAVKAAQARGEDTISFMIACTGTPGSKNQMSILSRESATAKQKPALVWNTELAEDAPADKKNLSWLVELVEEVAASKADFMAWDQQGFDAAVAAAKLVLADDAATMSAINDAEDTLMVRLFNLRLKLPLQK